MKFPNRTSDSLMQAAMVLGVIVLSPYAMMTRSGCEDEPVARDRGAPGVTKPPAHQVKHQVAAHETASPEPEPEDEQPPYQCMLPDVLIPTSEGCDEHSGYPQCKWAVPDVQEGPYRIWRYTTPTHRWGRPALVTLVLATAREYHRLTGEPVTVGDLDAPGNRHQTHDRGVDVDLYLPGRMATENMGKGRYEDNYRGQSPSYVDKCRQRVGLLARILATCSDGDIRIYYNDEPVIDSFRDWFEEQGLVTSFDAPMVPHNKLHLFHFHVTVAEDLHVIH